MNTYVRKVMDENNSLEVQVAFWRQVHEKKINVDGAILHLQPTRLEPGAPVRNVYIVTDQVTNKIHFHVNKRGDEISFERAEKPRI